MSEPIVIAHRGASGYLPEHTLAAYAMAHAMGADFIEPDIVASADGVLVCLHDIFLDATTNVATRYPGRARDDGRFYAADFTFAEIQQLTALERVGIDGERVFPQRYIDGAHGFQVPALAALVEMLDVLNRRTGRRVGVYPETKRPAFHVAEGLALEPALVDVLGANPDAVRDRPVYIQSFEPLSLQTLRHTLDCQAPMIQLIEAGAEFDAFVTDSGLAQIAGYADGIGPNKKRIEASGGRLVAAAHAHGLCVHPFTFRADQLPADAPDLETELQCYVDDYQVDGVFCDFPDRAAGVVHSRRYAP